jgi:DNA-binding NarL/FixJ family response regulator
VIAPIRVLIADDSFIVRGGLRMAVEAVSGFVVVGEASTGTEAVDLARELLPDVVLIDVRMPDVDGIAATRRISAQVPTVRTLVVTWSDEPANLRDAFVAGAKGYLVHGRFDPGELAAAMRALARDDISMMPVIAAGILAESGSGTRPALAADLTRRELEILRLVQRGRSNREIARDLGVEEKTVKNHINSIYSKLGLASRVEAMATRVASPADPSRGSRE